MVKAILSVSYGNVKAEDIVYGNEKVLYCLVLNAYSKDKVDVNSLNGGVTLFMVILGCLVLVAFSLINIICT